MKTLGILNFVDSPEIQKSKNNEAIFFIRITVIHHTLRAQIELKIVFQRR